VEAVLLIARENGGEWLIDSLKDRIREAIGEE
jgi:hypothetical protein